MIREIIEVVAGDVSWNLLKLRYHIDYSKVVLVLTGENADVDDYALKYLDKYIERKVAKEAVVIALDKNEREKLKSKYSFKYKTKIIVCSSKKIDRIYKRKCLNKINNNLVFTYIDKTKNNLLGKFLRETDINAKDVVCLALYNFRTNPEEIGTL